MVSSNTVEQAEWVGAFDANLFEALIKGTQPGLVADKRRQAFDVYRSLPAPTAFTEEWRRTDPSLFPLGRCEWLAPLQPSDDIPAGSWDASFDAAILVSDKGYAIEDPSGALTAAGIKAGPIDQMAAEVPDHVQQKLSGAALPPALGKFIALNAAFWNAGFYIHIPEGATLGKGILIRYRVEKEAALLVPRLVISAGAHSRVPVVETLSSSDEAEIQVVGAKEFYLGEAARLTFISLQEWGAKTCVISNERARVERDGCVEWINLNFGSKVSKLSFGSDVAGEGTAAELDGIYLVDGDQHIDQKTWQIHSSPNTYSRLLYKGAAKDRGHSVYQGVIQAKPGAIKVDAYQTNNNVVLNDGARADTIPGLLIDADDLKCSHGATIGNLDEEQIFYLRSRGLDHHEARRIVLLGFFDEVVQRIPYDFMREHVHERIVSKLGDSF